MTTVAYFGHDAEDSAVRRRVQGFRDDGLAVVGFMMRRGGQSAPEWINVDLGRTRDGAFLQRIMQVYRGSRIAANARTQLATADVIFARNLDMLACAFLARRYAKLRTPVIYECLDIHHLLTRNDMIGKVLRRVEKELLRRTIGLVVSSPGFLRNYFELHFAGLYRAFLVENRLAAGAEYGPRPDSLIATSIPAIEARPLRLGWVGILRCQRSLDLLCALADQFPLNLEIKLHGLPSRTRIPDFETVIDARANIFYAGGYRAPEDLLDVYSGFDIVWAGDFMEAGFNSVWLLPNRIYEGGYYAIPPIAPKGTETAAWIEKKSCGFTVDEPLERTLPKLVADLIADYTLIVEKAGSLLALPEDTFIQPPGFMAEVIAMALDTGG